MEILVFMLSITAATILGLIVLYIIARIWAVAWHRTKNDFEIRKAKEKQDHTNNK